MKTKVLVLTAFVALSGFACNTAQTTTTSTGTVAEATRAIAAYNSQDCLKEAERDGCWFSRGDQNNVMQYTQQCASFESGTGETKVIAWRLNNGDISFMKTKGRGVKQDACKVWKVVTGEGGTADLAVKKNKLFFRTNNGNVYYVTVDMQFNELLSGSRQPYKDVKRLDEAGNNIELVMKDDTKIEVTDAFLTKRRAAGSVIEVNADKVTTFISSVAEGGKSPFHN